MVAAAALVAVAAAVAGVTPRRYVYDVENIRSVFAGVPCGGEKDAVKVFIRWAMAHNFFLRSENVLYQSMSLQCFLLTSLL